MKRILLVEDEPNLAHSIKLNLEIDGYEVTLAKTGEEAILFFTEDPPFDLIILDVMLPKKNGFQVAEEIRKKDSTVGILMLTALANQESRIRGLGTGVDDYLTKPFNLVEFSLRVKRMIERSDWILKHSSNESREKIFSFAGYEVDPSRLEMSGPNGTFQLTKLELDMMREFLCNAGVTLSREHLLEKVWGVSCSIETRTIDNFVMRIRKMIEGQSSQAAIQSVRGVGYRFEPGEK